MPNIHINTTITCDNAPVEDVLEAIRKAGGSMWIDRLEDENANLEAANEAILAGESRPALPEGMRLAEHEEYGRVVVSPGTNTNGYYMFFASDDTSTPKACYWYAKPSELTFLEEEPAPAPLPKPEDCKAGEVYRVKAAYRDMRGVGVAVRSDPDDPNAPWLVSLDDGKRWWVPDSAITLLARLTPDRKVQA